MTDQLGPDWHLKEWMIHFGKKQADLVKELDWQRARASKVWNGKLPYKRELVNEIAQWLGLEPFELLLQPERALAIRAFYQSAENVVQATDRFLPPPVVPIATHRRPKTGS